MSPARPQKSSSRRPISAEDQLRRAAVERQYVPTRRRNTPAQEKLRQENLQRNGNLALPIIKPISRPAAIKTHDGDDHAEKSTQHAEAPHEPEHATIQRPHLPPSDVQQPLSIPIPLPKVKYADAAIQTSPASKTTTRQFQNQPKQGKQRKDIYEVPEDASGRTLHF